MLSAIPLTFLGTGNFTAQERYWNGFLIGGTVMVEVPPTALPNLFRAHVDPRAIAVIFLSHFHADHSFGWPFLLLDSLSGRPRTAPLWIVGPPGLEAFLQAMVHAGALAHLVERGRAAGGYPIHYIEVDEAEQEAGGVSFRAVRVDHDPALDCYGYLIASGGRTIGYSGDGTLSDGLRRIAAGSDALVLECNQRHNPTLGHMSLAGVRTLRAEFPTLPFILTHVGADVDSDGIPLTRLPADLETLMA